MAATTQQQRKNDEGGMFARMGRFFREVREEGRKVTWPTREKAWSDVMVVLLASAIMGALIGVEDFLLTQVFQWFLIGGS